MRETRSAQVTLQAVIDFYPSHPDDSYRRVVLLRPGLKATAGDDLEAVMARIEKVLRQTLN